MGDADEPLRVERRPGATVLTLNRPRARNALDGALLHALESALAEAAADRSLAVLLLRGAGGYFCAGGDLKERAAMDGPALEGRSLREGELLALLDRQPQIVVAAVAGGAVGAGLGLLCACDLVLAEAGARFAAPEIRSGALPAQISPHVAGAVGWRQARRLLLTGEAIDAEEARRIHLVHEIAGDGAALDAAAEERLARLAALPPASVAATKALFGRLRPGDADYPRFAAGAYASARPDGL